MKNWIVVLILSFFIQACGISMGDRVDNGNLSVYFLEDVGKNNAIKFSRYWKNNDLVGEQKQVIQLERIDGIIVIKLIEREIYHADPFTIEEEAMLQNLERDLKKEVFDEDVEIMITDNTFRPIIKRQ
ncbi:hypothetical protein [Brumimicrobium aurantiacum]|uniref:Uncharacterized protein n=1 Tax=Brumimicrobium aurantiacum TaxID=1737063 RepID=A0A3E1EWB2_9FLAO|nr:hypothetical protein [Brumimicrobium aurantiacum]RFC53808.1 hypothetical protein DXU93_11820 [Brumimicrobium aurantiacum]